MSLFQKFKNAIKSDLLEKCPKCEEQECDCVLNDDIIEPMIILSPSESNKEVNSAPMFTVPTATSLRTLNDKTYQSITPSATMTHLDKMNET